MKFDSSAIPVLPNPQELTELNDLLLSATELHRVYTSLEKHPRIIGSAKSLELFTSCREQLHLDVSLLDKQLETLLTLSKAKSGEIPANIAQLPGTEGHSPYMVIPDVEPTNPDGSVFEVVRRCFHLEDIFNDQLNACLRSAQKRKHLKLELQLKMIILSADQRCKLLEDRYGYARSKNLLFQGLRRQTTRFISALTGEVRIDIDR